MNMWNDFPKRSDIGSKSRHIQREAGPGLVMKQNPKQPFSYFDFYIAIYLEMRQILKICCLIK